MTIHCINTKAYANKTKILGRWTCIIIIIIIIIIICTLGSNKLNFF